MLDPALAGEYLAYRLMGLRASIDQMELEFSRLAADFDAEHYWAEDGSNSAIDWIRINCKMTSTAAADRVAVGRKLGELEQTVKAMDEGEIGFAHLTVMTRTADAVGEAFDESKLLGLAKETSPGKFHYKCMHYRHSVDPKAYNSEQADLVEGRELHLSTTADGCLIITGALDPVGGAAVRTALEPLARPTGAHDGRVLAKRYADALVELATNGGGKVRVAMQVTASIETLLGACGAPGAENEFTLPIASPTVERWACDCQISRVLLQDSVVIDVGRAERTIKGPRRRALMARDRHCRWPGCDRPASWCEGHHLEHWIHGGGGEIGNQVLLCRRHHWMVHEGGWQIVKTEDERLLPIAPVIRFGLPAPPSN